MTRPPASRRLHALLVAVLALLPILAPPLTAAPAAGAVATNQALDIVLLGDSYSAGNGAGSYYGPQGSYRSSNNWAHQYTSWLNQQGVSTTLTNLAHSGSVTDQVLTQQVPAIPAGTDLVMLTIGGNDAGFSQIVTQCFAVGLRDPRSCRSKVDAANASMPTVKAQTRRILEAIDARLPDGAQVVLVGYPRLATDRPYVLRSFFTSYDAGTAVRGLSDTSRQVQAALVEEWNASHPGLQVTYVDTVVDAFDGHEADPAVTSRNSYRWLNEFLETEGRAGADGTTTSVFSANANNWYHPNVIGHQQIADLIVAELGVPTSTQPVGAAADLDVALVVNTTGDMHDDISAARTSIGSVMEQIATSTASHRFALVEYQDAPASGEQAAQVRTVVDFTTDTVALEAALDSLAAQAASQEASDAGAGQTADLSWREGTQKVTLVLGDGAPAAPAGAEEPTPAATQDVAASEPDDAVTGTDGGSTGRAAQEAAQVVSAQTAASVYVIDTGGLETQGLAEIVEDSGGTLARADSSQDVAQLLSDAVDAELAKPVAWIQGPLVAATGQSVEIDASASYASSGSLTVYEWDLDGDGTYEQSTSAPVLSQTFPAPLDGEIGLRVTQSDGLTATATAAVTITNDGDSTPDESDNCPDTANHGQSDYDGDGIGDECDPEPGHPTTDRLGVCVVGESCPEPSTGPLAVRVPVADSSTPEAADPRTGSGSSTPSAVVPTPGIGSPVPAAGTPSRGLLARTGPQVSTALAGVLLAGACGAALLGLRRRRSTG